MHVVALLGLVLCLCGGCRGERRTMVVPELQWYLETTDTGAVLSLRAGAQSQAEQQALRLLRRLHLQVRSPEGDVLEELEIVPALSGMAQREGGASLLLSERIVLRTPPERIPAQVRLQYRYETDSGSFQRELLLQRVHRSGALLLVPSVEVSDSGVTFRLRVRRIQPVEREYFPSSERLRVELFRGVKRVWSSAEGVAFLQVIGVVEPVEPGQEQEYSLRWDGRIAAREELPAGLYRLRLSLPARPQEYAVELPFRWRMP